MHDREYYLNGTVRSRFEADLGQVRNAINSCVGSIKPAGLTASAVAPLIEVAAGLSSLLPPLDPLVRKHVHVYILLPRTGKRRSLCETNVVANVRYY